MKKSPLPGYIGAAASGVGLLAFQAQAFLHAYVVLIDAQGATARRLIPGPVSEEDSHAIRLSGPAITCVAFAVELALKTLLRDEETLRDKAGHQLSPLARDLSPKRLQGIADRLKMPVEVLLAGLQLEDSTFEHFRYAHEYTALSTSFDFLENVARAALLECGFDPGPPSHRQQTGGL